MVGLACFSGSAGAEGAPARPGATSRPTAAPSRRPGGPRHAPADRSRAGTASTSPPRNTARRGAQLGLDRSSEYSASGTATSYRSTGPLPTNGRFRLTPGTDRRVPHAHPRASARPAAFNGTVIVEWLNVSGGLDADPDCTSAQRDPAQRVVWVGVSAQPIGVEGGPVAVACPRRGRPARARASSTSTRSATEPRHPGDAYSFDIYTRSRGAAPPNGSCWAAQVRTCSRSANRSRRSRSPPTSTASSRHPHVRRLFRCTAGAAPPRRSASPARASTSRARSAGNRPRSAPTVVRRSSWSRPRPTSSASSGRTRHATRQRPLPVVGGRRHCPRRPVPGRRPSRRARLSRAPLNDGPSRFVVRTSLPRPRPVGAHRGRTTEGAASSRSTPPTPPTSATGSATFHGGIRTPLVDTPVDTLSGESAGGSIVCILFGFAAAHRRAAPARATRRESDYRRPVPRRGPGVRSHRASCSPTTGLTSCRWPSPSASPAGVAPDATGPRSLERVRGPVRKRRLRTSQISRSYPGLSQRAPAGCGRPPGRGRAYRSVLDIPKELRPIGA